jgi:hypothetical protein
LSALASAFQQGLGYFQTGAQIAGGLANAFGGSDPGARDFAMWANRLGQGAGQVGGFLQGVTGSHEPAGGGMAAAQFQQPAMLAPPASSVPPPATTSGSIAAPGLNATALMGLLMSNPQLVQALQSAPFSASPPGVSVDVPNRGAVSIPLGALMSSLAQLSQASSRELSELWPEDEAQVPEYLLAEDGSPVVDISKPRDRAALALYWLRRSAEAQRYGVLNSRLRRKARIDPVDAWARDAGFDD